MHRWDQLIIVCVPHMHIDSSSKYSCDDYCNVTFFTNNSYQWILDNYTLLEFQAATRPTNLAVPQGSGLASVFR